MRITLFGSLLLLSLAVKAQPDIKARGKTGRDSLVNVLARELLVSKEKADSVLLVIDRASGEIKAALGFQPTGEDGQAQARQIAARRDEQIERMLTPEQVRKLKAVFASQKEKLKHRPSPQ